MTYAPSLRPSRTHRQPSQDKATATEPNTTVKTTDRIKKRAGIWFRYMCPFLTRPVAFSERRNAHACILVPAGSQRAYLHPAILLGDLFLQPLLDIRSRWPGPVNDDAHYGGVGLGTYL